MGVTPSVELFQDPRDVAAFILGVRNVYLGGFPASTHGEDDGRINGIRHVTQPRLTADQRGSKGIIRPPPHGRSQCQVTPLHGGGGATHRHSLQQDHRQRKAQVPHRTHQLPCGDASKEQGEQQPDPRYRHRMRVTDGRRPTRGNKSLSVPRVIHTGGVVYNRHRTCPSSSPALCSPAPWLRKEGSRGFDSRQETTQPEKPRGLVATADRSPHQPMVAIWPTTDSAHRAEIRKGPFSTVRFVHIHHRSLASDHS